MAGNLYGADVAELRLLGDRVARSADDLDRIAKLLTNQIGTATAWVGPNAQKFRAEWAGTHRGSISVSVRALRECADALRRNADQQARASAEELSSAGRYHGGPRDAGGGLADTNQGGVGGGVAGPYPLGIGQDDLAVRDTLEDLRTVQLPTGMVAWDTALAIGAVVGDPVSRTVSDIQTYGGAVESLIAGDLSLSQMADVVSTTLKKAPPFSVAHLGGMAIGMWSLVGQEAAKTDFSATGFADVVTEINRDPIGSMNAAVVSLERSMPDFISALF